MNIHKRNSGNRRWVVALGVLAFGVALAPGLASAHRSPANCDADLTVLGISKNPVGTVVEGQVVTYTVSIGNPGPGAGVPCDAGDIGTGDGASDGIDVFFKCPRPDGTAPGPGDSLAGSPAPVTLGLGLPLRANGTNNKTFPTGNSDCTGLGTSVFGFDACCMGVMTGTCPSTKCQIQANDMVDTVFATARMDGDYHVDTVDGIADKQSQPPVSVQPCRVEIDKQVSCDGGTTFVDANGFTNDNNGGITEFCAGWNTFDSMPAEDVVVRYAVRNPAGGSNLFGCKVMDSNTDITDMIDVGNLVAGGSSGNIDRTNACSEPLDDNEPNTATVSCFCTAEQNMELTATAFDSAEFDCQTPGLAVNKVCAPQDGNSNAVTITVTNNGTADLENCTVTDQYVADSSCPVVNGGGTPVTVSPDTFDLAAGDPAQNVTGSIAGLTESACNEASVTCDIVDSGTPPKQITSDDDDLCETPGDGCLTRTPGFWKNHPQVTDDFIPVTSCGVLLDTTKKVTQDMCINANEAKAAHTSPQQLQLIRQCAAANLNVAATLEGGGNCESEMAGITRTIADCCNGYDSTCRSGLSGQAISESGCIESLDAFNNSIDTLLPFGPFDPPGKAQPSECKASSKDKTVNPGRTLGPS